MILGAYADFRGITRANVGYLQKLNVPQAEFQHNEYECVPLSGGQNICRAAMRDLL